MIRGIVFDLDGLMIDSESLALEAWQRCLEPYAVSLTKEQYQHLIGTSHQQTQQLIAKITGVELPSEKAEARFWEYVLDLIGQRGAPEPGLMPLLQDLERRGYRLGVASNSPSHYVSQVLKLIGAAPYIAYAVGADAVARPKPAPDVYQQAARGLGLCPGECLAFEDSPTGVQAALASGMCCVLIPSPHIEQNIVMDGVRVFSSLSACHAALDDILACSPETNSG